MDDDVDVTASCGCVFCDLNVDVFFDGDRMLHATGNPTEPWVPCTK